MGEENGFFGIDRFRRGNLTVSEIKVCLRIFIVSFLLLNVLCSVSLSASPESIDNGSSVPEIETAPVIIDNITLFPVRGISAYPAKERARTIAERIKNVASDQSIPVEAVTTVEADTSTNLVAGNYPIMKIVDADAALEGVMRQQLGEIYVAKIRSAIIAYRSARTPENIIRAVLYSVAATVAVVIAIFVVSRLFRKLLTIIESSSKEKLRSLETKLLGIFGAEGVWPLVRDTLKTVRLIVIIVLVYTYIHEVFSFFPWSERYAFTLLDYIVNPLKFIGLGILKEIPDLIFIAVLVIIIRLGLKVLHVFFRQIEMGTRTIAGFYPEWAKPTDQIITILVIAFAVVVAFPYIPGSNSAAFKGISIFIGVLFSLGSQSAVANTIAGFIVHYRRAFKMGDRIQVNDIVGDVMAIRMQVTHVLTIKNEEVIIPNSVILGSHIVNYSSLARDKGLILHTEVTIGYDAPWRQVHAMLLKAAERTNGLLKEPAPFVLQKSLDDFFVRYELNAYTDTPQTMALIYSELHRNIQDSFNEYGVQIMSPHYLGDPAKAKIVPKNNWYEPPAEKSEKEMSE